MNSFVSLAARLVPHEWRAGVLRDLEDEAAGRHGRGWVSWQLARIGVRARLSFGGGALHVDLLDAWRSLRAAPVVAVVAVLSVALGVGANTAIFSILDSLALKTLPVRAPEQLFELDHGSVWWTNPLWEQIRARQHDVFEGAFAWASARFDLAASGGQPDPIDGAYVSGRMFDVLGLAPVGGRLFTEADDARGGGPDGPVAVLGYDFWQRHFGGSLGVIGQRLSLSHVPFTIVGIAPPAFAGPEVGRAAKVFIPIGTEPLVRGAASALDNRLSWWLQIVVRTRAGQSLDVATADLRRVQSQIREATLPTPGIPAAQQARYYLPDPFSLRPAANGGVSEISTRLLTPLTAMLAVVGLVLLVACLNIAHLLLLRAAARRHELSVRLALGSSRGRLVRQLMIESVLLAGSGGLLGLAMAQAGARLFIRQFTTPTVAIFLDLATDWRVFAFAVAVTLVTAICFGVGSALAATRVSPVEAIKEQGRGVVGQRRFGAPDVLVVTQVALSLVPVVAAGLFMRTFSQLTKAPLGITSDPIVIAVLPGGQGAPSDQQAVFDRLQQSAAAVPGVARTALSVVVPLAGGGWDLPIEIDGGPWSQGHDSPWINASSGQGNGLPGREATSGLDISWINGVTPGWFDVYGMHLVSGRDFTTQDRPGAPNVAIVNELFSRTFFSGQNPIGHLVTGGMDGSSPFGEASFTIVGVVSDALYRSIREGMMPTLYVPLAQVTGRGGGVWEPKMSIAATPSAELTRELAEAFGRVEPQATFTFLTLDGEIRAMTAQERIVAILSCVFGGLALLLAAIGLYGVTSYAVSRRRGEIGVRMVLGADARDVTQLVLGRVARLIAIGVIIGAVIACWAARFVSPLLLFGVGARDARTLVAGAVVLAVVGALAGWLPARRAGRIDPTEVLREPGRNTAAGRTLGRVRWLHRGAI